MHTPSVFVASVAILSTFAVAEVERPKFYFPRQIKREVVNKYVAQPAPRRVAPATHKRALFGEDGILNLGGRATGDATTSTSETDVVTVVVQSTVFAGDAAGKSASATTTTAKGGILFGPDGLLSNLDPTTTSPSSTPASTTSSGIDGPGTATETDSSSTTPAGTTIAEPATAAAPSTTADTPDLGAVVSSIGADISSAIAPATTADPTTTAADPSSTPDAAVTDAPTTTADPASDTTVPTTTAGPLDTASSIISGIVDPTGTGTGIDTVTPTVTPTGTDVATITDPPVSTALPTDTATLPPADATPTEGINPNGTVSTLPPGVTPTILPDPSDNTTVIGTGSLTDLIPTGINTSGVSQSGAPTGGLNGTSVEVDPTPTGTATLTDDTAQKPTEAPPTTVAPQTIEPTGTNTATQFVPSQITFAASPTGTDIASTTATGIPSALPKVIAPPGGPPDTPVDNTLVQVGFTYPLNYPFVVNEWRASLQVFTFLPAGMADGLGISRDKVIMHSLTPFDTTRSLGFVTTIGQLYVPSNMVDQLRVALLTPLSAMYTNEDGSINTLMNLINPSIQLLPGSTLPISGGSVTGTDSGAEATPSTGSSGGGIFSTDEQAEQTPKKAGQVAGVAFAAVAAAAGYGAAMFFIARRYKRKRSLHRRASSVNPGEMRQTGSPALMGGALAGRTTPGSDRNSRGSGRTGNSARTAQISAPMMAENSLGWN